jgi:hypothetical protein
MKLIDISQNKPIHPNFFGDIDQRLVSWQSVNSVTGSQNSSTLFNISTDYKNVTFSKAYLP